MCGGSLLHQINCTAVFLSLNNSSIVSFSCLTKILWLKLQLKFKACGRDFDNTTQTIQSVLNSFCFFHHHSHFATNLSHFIKVLSEPIAVLCLSTVQVREDVRFHIHIDSGQAKLQVEFIKPGFHIAVRCRKVAGASVLPSSICHAPGTTVERFKWKRLSILPQPPCGGSAVRCR